VASLQRIPLPFAILLIAGLFGTGTLFAHLSNLGGAARAASDVAELRANALRITIDAERAYLTGSTAELEAGINGVESQADRLGQAAGALDPESAQRMLDDISAEWRHFVTTARERARGEASSGELLLAGDRMESSLDALVSAVTLRTESYVALVSRGAQAALVAGGVVLLLTGGLIARAARRHLTDFDERTQLFREPYVVRSLARRLAAGGDVGVLVVGFDGIERFRAAFGRDSVDTLVARVAAHIGDSIPAGSTIGRGDGDELVVVVDGDADQVIAAAEAIIGALDEPVTLGGIELRLTAVVGAAIGHEHGIEAADRLVLAAERASAAARANDLDFAVFDPLIDATSSREDLVLEAQLSRALERGEFRLFFQPQIALRSGQIIGAEALLRWESPTEGLVAPARFLPVLEASNLMRPVGEWVIRHALAEAATWPVGPEGAPLRIAVNISGRQLSDDRLTGLIADALAGAQVDGSRLEIEITETAALQRPEVAASVVAAVRALGARAAIDDFGTGGSSLERVRALPGDAVKIDRTFVAGLADRPADLAIVRAAVSIARALGRETVAEGVSTRQDADLLRAVGCDAAQGEWIAMPMSGDELRAFLREWRPEQAASSVNLEIAHAAA